MSTEILQPDAERIRDLKIKLHRANQRIYWLECKAGLRPADVQESASEEAVA